jgi:outer membrane receptor protein involved in Fe transport
LPHQNPWCGMQKHFTLLLFICSLLLVNVCYSQSGKVWGVLSFEDGSPVAFATVVLQPIKKHCLSDENGHYEITGVPYGTYQADISSLEIQKSDLSISVNAPSTKQSFVLKKAKASMLNEVVVEGESIKREMETQGFAVNVIETKKASLQSLQTNELLDRTVGIRVRQNGGLGSAVNYNLNGMSGNSVRIFIDGTPISTYGSSFSLNSIPPALIERIEVYKGVVPAHLADDALGGAINVILKKGLANNLVASVSYGSFNTLQSNVNTMFRNSRTGFTVRASAFYNYSDNDYEVWGKFVRNIQPNGRYEYVRARRFNDAYRSAGGQLELGFTDVKWADQFFIGYNGSDDYKEIQHGNYMTIPYMGRFAESQSHVVNLNYRKRDFLIKGLEATFSGMYSNRSQVVNDTVRWNYNWFGERSIGLNGEPILRPAGAQQAAPTINHIGRNVSTYRAGLIYTIRRNHRLVLNHMFYNIDRREQDEMRPQTERDFIGTRDLQKNVSSAAYEITALNARLKTSFFGKYYQQKMGKMDPVLVEQNGQKVRHENHTTNQRATTGYGMAVSYTLKPTIVLLSSAEKAIRMPAENEIFGSPGENIVENLGIRPEVSNNLNLGFRAGPFNRNVHRLSFSGSGFTRDTQDQIVQRINPRLNDAVQTNPFENLGKTKSIGFEAEMNYTLKNNLNVHLNMSKFNSVFNQRYDANGNEYSYYNKQLPNEPFFTINSTVQYTFRDLIAKHSLVNLHYGFGFVDRFYTTWLEIEDFRTPRQFIQDIGVNYVFPNKKFVVSADAKNIFDRQAYDNFAVQKPGRAFYVKLNYTINNF